MNKALVIGLVVVGVGAAAYFLLKKSPAKEKGDTGGGTGAAPTTNCATKCTQLGGKFMKVNTKPPHYRCMKGTALQFSCLTPTSRIQA